MEPRRASDTEGSDFSRARIPKKWEFYLKVIAGIGTFLATFYYASPYKREAAPSDEFSRISMEIESLKDSIESLKLNQETLMSQNKDLKRGIQEVSRKARPCDEDLLSDRHSELLESIKSLDKRGRR